MLHPSSRWLLFMQLPPTETLTVSRINLKSSRDWLVVGLVATAGMVFFTVGLIGLARITDQAPPTSPATVGTRIAVSIVVAALMLIVERRRHQPSVDAAIVDGIQVAAVVIVAGNLTGTPDAGVPLALRSALVLLGLPLLEVLTHVLDRDAGAAAQERSP